jgi:hypothetical protein
VHQPCAHTTAPIGGRHPERVDVEACPAKVAEDLPLGVLGRPLQTGGDISDHPAVDLTDQPDGVVRPWPSQQLLEPRRQPLGGRDLEGVGVERGVMPGPVDPVPGKVRGVIRLRRPDDKRFHGRTLARPNRRQPVSPVEYPLSGRRRCATVTATAEVRMAIMVLGRVAVCDRRS